MTPHHLLISLLLAGSCLPLQAHSDLDNWLPSSGQDVKTITTFTKFDKDHEDYIITWRIPKRNVDDIQSTESSLAEHFGGKLQYGFNKGRERITLIKPDNPTTQIPVIPAKSKVGVEILSISKNQRFQTHTKAKNTTIEQKPYLRPSPSPFRNQKEDEVVVALIDTGVAINHPDLVKHIYVNPNEIPNNGIDDDNNGYVDDTNGYNFVDRSSDVHDFHGHGTYIAGIITSAANSASEENALPAITLMPLKFDFDNITTIEAINYAIDNGADVINFGWDMFQSSEHVEEAVQRAAEANILVITVAGTNLLDARYDPSYPAASESTLAVGYASSETPPQNLASFGMDVDLIAPFQNIPAATLPRYFLYQEDFENTPAGSIPTDSSQEGDDGVWSVSTFPEIRPDDLVLRADAQAAFPYRSQVAGTWTSPVIDLEGQTNITFSMDIYSDKDSCSNVLLEAFDGNQWVNWLDLNGTFFEDRFFDFEFPVNEELLHNQFQIRLSWFASDNQLIKGGFAVDNIAFYTETPIDNPISIAYSGARNTPSVAPAQVSGAAARIYAQYPGITAEAAAARLMYAGPVHPHNTFSNRVLNLAESLAASGDLSLHTQVLPSRVGLGSIVKIGWSHFNPTDETVTLELEHNGTVIQALAENLPANHRFSWQVDALPGSGYAFRLSSPSQTLHSPAFEVFEHKNITFADTNLETWLVEQYDRNKDGYVDEDEALYEVSTIRLNNAEITSLDGLEHFENLLAFYFGYNQITHLPDLSNLKRLVEIDLRNNRLQEAPLPLPDSLLELNLNFNQLTQLPELPAQLTDLSCGGNQLTELPQLPDSLIALFCHNNNLTQLPDIDGLAVLHCNGNQLTQLPSLPQDLGGLFCRNNLLTELPALPCSLSSLDAANNQLQTLPDLPLNIASITVDNNRLTDLANISELENLDWVRAAGNELTQVDPFGVDRFFWATFYNNPLEDISWMLDLEDMGLRGLRGSLLNSDTLDGIIWNPDFYGERRDCEDAQDNAIDSLVAVWEQPGRLTLNWERGSICSEQTARYRVWLGETLIGATECTNYTLETSAEIALDLTVEAINAVERVLSSSTIQVTEPAPQTYTYIIPKPTGNPDEWTGLALTQTSAAQAQINVSAMAGVVLDSKQTQSTAQARTLMVPCLELDQPQQTQWYKLESDAALNGLALFGNGPHGFSGGALEDHAPRLNGWVPGADFMRSPMGIDIINPNDTPVAITLEIYLKSGEHHHTGSLNLAPGERRHGHISDLVDMPHAINLGMIAWRADAPTTVNSVFYAMGERDFLAVTPSLGGGQLYGVLPRVTSPTISLATHVDHYTMVHNPNNLKTTLMIRAFDQRGRFVDEVAMQLNPNETRWFDNAFLYFGTRAEDLHIHFGADNPINLVNYHQDYQNQFTRWKMESITPNPHLGSQFRVPHVARPEMWETEITITNPDNLDKVITLQSLDASGATLESKSITLNSNAHLRIDPIALFQEQQPSMVDITVTGGVLAVNLLYTPILGAGEGMADIALKPTTP